MATKELEFEWTTEDFTEDEKSEFEKKVLVDAGTYDVIVSDCKTGESKAGNVKVVFEFTIKGGKFSGEKLSKHVPIQGKGAGIARKVLLAFHDREELVGGFRLVPDNYIGEKAIVVVARGEYTNEYGTFPSADVERVLRADDPDARVAVEETRNGS